MRRLAGRSARVRAGRFAAEGPQAVREAVATPWVEAVYATEVAWHRHQDIVLVTRNYEAAIGDLNTSRTPDPDPYLFWHQSEATGGQNYSQWDNRTASEYLETARTAADFNERTRLYRNFQVVFAKELPSLPLYYPVYSYGVDSQVQGVQVAPMYDVSDRLALVAEWYLVTRRTLEQTPVPTVVP